jgi:hypothetical protein
VTAALGMLAYDIPADLVDDNLTMDESMAIMCVKSGENEMDLYYLKTICCIADKQLVVFVGEQFVILVVLSPSKNK